MPSKLDQIVAATRRKIARSQAGADLRLFEQQAQKHTARGFRQSIAGHDGVSIIAEIKKASPSRGLIRADFDPAYLASELELAGAAALSVLTDEEFFQGTLQNLQKASVSTHLPCL